MTVANPLTIKKGNSRNCDDECKAKQRDEANKQNHGRIIRKPKNETKEG